jgi:hypothetical protein
VNTNGLVTKGLTSYGESRMTVADNYVQLQDGRWIEKAQLRQYKDQLRKYREIRVINAEELYESPDIEIKSLWGEFIFPESLHLFSGEAGVGKTTFFYNLAIKAIRGEDFVGIPFSRALKTLYLDLETPELLRNRKLRVIAEEKPKGLFFIPSVDLESDISKVLDIVWIREITVL